VRVFLDVFILDDCGGVYVWIANDDMESRVCVVRELDESERVWQSGLVVFFFCVHMLTMLRSLSGG